MELTPSIFNFDNDYQATIFDYVLQRLQPQVESGHSILDVGCGSGLRTAQLHQALFGNGGKDPSGRMVGLDISKDYIAEASKKYSTKCKFDVLNTYHSNFAGPNTNALLNKSACAWNFEGLEFVVADIAADLTTFPHSVFFKERRSRSWTNPENHFIACHLQGDCFYGLSKSPVLGVNKTRVKNCFRDKDHFKSIIQVDALKTFDHVVSFSCLQWVGDQVRALRNILRLLGGQIHTSTSKRYSFDSSPSFKSENGDFVRVTDDPRRSGKCHLIVLKESPLSLNTATDIILSSPRWFPYTTGLRRAYQDLRFPWKRSWMVFTDPESSYRYLMECAGFDRTVITPVKSGLDSYTFPSVTVMRQALIDNFPSEYKEIPVELREEFFDEFLVYLLEDQKYRTGNELTSYAKYMWVEGYQIARDTDDID